MNALPKINDKRYSWSSIELRALNYLVTGITSITYEHEVKAITLYSYEIEVILESLPKGRHLKDVPAFDVVVSYLDDDNDIIINVIRNCQFTQQAEDIAKKKGDIEVLLPFTCSHIEWN